MIAAAWTLLAYVGLLSGGVAFGPPGIARAAIVGVFAIALTIIVGTTIAIDIPQVRRRLRRLRRAPWPFLLVSMLYFAFWPIAVLPFFFVDGEFRVGHKMMAAMALLFVPYAHWTLYASYRIVSARANWAKGIMLGLVLFYSGAPLTILDGALNAFGLGMMRRVDLVLSPRGCDIVHAAWPTRACTSGSRGGAGAHRLDNVEVLTRIGSHFYVTLPGGMADDRLPRAMIPATEVLSWHRAPKPDASASASPMPASSAPRGATGP
jgi:Ca2+/Na+ antiporter